MAISLDDDQPTIQAPQYITRLARALDLKGRAIAPTLSPEIQPVVQVENLSDPKQRRGVACLGVVAGGVGTRSEIALVVVNGRLTRDQLLYLPRMSLLFPVGADFEVMLEIATAGFNTFNPAYGDAGYGDIAPFVIQEKSTAAASAGGRSFLGGVWTAPANVEVAMPLNVSLRAGDLFPDASNVLLVRATTNQVAFRGWFEWQVLPDVR